MFEYLIETKPLLWYLGYVMGKSFLGFNSVQDHAKQQIINSLQKQKTPKVNFGAYQISFYRSLC